MIINQKIKEYLQDSNVSFINFIWNKYNGSLVVGYQYDCKTREAMNKTVNRLYRMFRELDLDYSICENYAGGGFSIYFN